MDDDWLGHHFVYRAAAGLVSLLILASPPPANAWRFGTRLIEPGHTQYEVSAKCGDPEEVEYRNEWRLQTVLQQQCSSVLDGSPQLGPGYPGGSEYRINRPPPRTLCTTIPLSYSVPVEVTVWFYEDVSVPKALYFEQGRLVAIESLWGLRH